MVQLGHLHLTVRKILDYLKSENQDKLMLAGQITKFEVILQLLGE